MDPSLTFQDKLIDTHKAQFLIVEDEVFSCKYLASILKKLGYDKVLQATNAQDALSIIKSHKIDIVFMDINIKGAIDGIQCSEILNQEYCIPIIYTTAYSDSSIISEASKTNLYAYLIKPFEIHDVEASLKITFKLLENLKTQNNQTQKRYNDNLTLADNIIYNFPSKTLLKDGTPIKTTKKELELLDFFCKNINKNISYDILKVNVWDNQHISNSTIRDSVSRLKRKVPAINLENIISFGYILKGAK